MYSTVRIRSVFRFLFLTIFLLTDFLSSVLFFDRIGSIILLLMALDLMMQTYVSGIRRSLLTLISWSLCFLVVSSFFWPTFYTVYAYVGLLVPIWIITFFHKADLYKFLLGFLSLQVLLCLWEYTTQQYIYEGLASRLGSEVILSFREVSGNVIRAKGTFIGPLALSNFALGASFLYFKKNNILLLSIILSLLSNSRLALVVLLLLFLVLNFSIKKVFRIIFVGTVLTIGALSFLDSNGLLRILEVGNLSANNHVMRLYFMNSGLQHFFNYDIIHQIFGSSGSLLLAIGNNAENGWITLLCEFGVLGFLLYIIPWVFAMSRANSGGRTALLLLFLVMVSQTFYLSLIGPLVYWLPILKYDDNKENT